MVACASSVPSFGGNSPTAKAAAAVSAVAAVVSALPGRAKTADLSAGASRRRRVHIVAFCAIYGRSTMAQTGVSGLVVVDGESFLDALFASAGQGRGTRQHRLQVDGRRRRHRSWPGRCEMRRLRCTTRQQRRWQQRQMHRAMHDLCPLWRPRCPTRRLRHWRQRQVADALDAAGALSRMTSAIYEAPPALHDAVAAPLGASLPWCAAVAPQSLHCVGYDCPALSACSSMLSGHARSMGGCSQERCQEYCTY
jgi:hypothetical protein